MQQPLHLSGLWGKKRFKKKKKKQRKETYLFKKGFANVSNIDEVKE